MSSNNTLYVRGTDISAPFVQQFYCDYSSIYDGLQLS
jgi:hypothetical protein